MHITLPNIGQQDLRVNSRAKTEFATCLYADDCLEEDTTTII